MDNSFDRQGITQLLRQWSSGNKDALDALMPLVYEPSIAWLSAACGVNARTTLCVLLRWYMRSTCAWSIPMWTGADGARGVELLRAHGQSIRLVLLDLSMPWASGEETMREIRKIRPDLPVVLSSGYSEGSTLRRFDPGRPPDRNPDGRTARVWIYD
jgi:CheY-like chemotaxis protein